MDVKVNDVLDMIESRIKLLKTCNERIEKIEVTDTGNTLEFKVVIK